MDIRDVFNSELEVLKELNDVLDNEREILIKDKASELIDILEKKKLIAKKISLLEKKRQELTNNSSAEDLINIGALTKAQVDNMKRLADSAKEKGEVNLILTRQSINYIRMITSSLNPALKIVTYGNNGKVDDGNSSNVFTTKV